MAKIDNERMLDYLSMRFDIDTYERSVDSYYMLANIGLVLSFLSRSFFVLFLSGLFICGIIYSRKKAKEFYKMYREVYPKKIVHNYIDKWKLKQLEL